jgi:hypothetical protein
MKVGAALMPVQLFIATRDIPAGREVLVSYGEAARGGG